MISISCSQSANSFNGIKKQPKQNQATQNQQKKPDTLTKASALVASLAIASTLSGCQNAVKRTVPELQTQVAEAHSAQVKKGPDGHPGMDGVYNGKPVTTPSQTCYIDEDGKFIAGDEDLGQLFEINEAGNWTLNGEDTGVEAQGLKINWGIAGKPGKDGISPYHGGIKSASVDNDGQLYVEFNDDTVEYYGEIKKMAQKKIAELEEKAKYSEEINKENVEKYGELGKDAGSKITYEILSHTDAPQGPDGHPGTDGLDGTVSET